MQIGYVQKREMAVREGESCKTVSYYEMHVRLMFGGIEKFTLSKNKSDHEQAPEYNIYAHNTKGWINRKIKVGALWMRTLDDGTQFLSGHIETPLVPNGKMQISLWRAKPLYDSEEITWEYDVVWKPYNPGKENSGIKERTISDTDIPIDIDEDEIPF